MRPVVAEGRASGTAGLGHAWQLVERSHGGVRVGGLAEAVGWSRRRLSTRSHVVRRHPKVAARVDRHHHSRRQVACRVPIAEPAALSGYADQPHLTREWRDLSGCTPRANLRQEVPFVQDRDAHADPDSSS